MMRYSVMAVTLLGCLFTPLALSADSPETGTTEAPARLELKSEEEKVNYSLGYELGKDLKRFELELMPDALLQGVRDSLNNGKALVSTTQRSKALKAIREARAANNLEESNAFLARIAEKDDVVKLPSGLLYREIKPGDGATPNEQSSVTVQYHGYLIDGTEFDSSYERNKPAVFMLRKVIKGWREGLRLMKTGAKWELFIPPDLAYGKNGRSKTIPPNSALVFEVELLEVK